MTALRTPVAARPSGAAAGTTPGQKGDTRRAGGREPAVVKAGEELDPAGLSSLLTALRQAEPEDCWQDRECPVIAECLQYALDHDEHFGVYGGMSERERRRLRWRVA